MRIGEHPRKKCLDTDVAAVVTGFGLRNAS